MPKNYMWASEIWEALWQGLAIHVRRGDQSLGKKRGGANSHTHTLCLYLYLCLSLPGLGTY